MHNREECGRVGAGEELCDERGFVIGGRQRGCEGIGVLEGDGGEWLFRNEETKGEMRGDGRGRRQPRFRWPSGVEAGRCMGEAMADGN
ncbi:hypothetical protein GUJ93_ZPchr0005g15317 [Zizania palustris]|uniref:Uncharacterized protein n=1 Tax=Zizania palustris TaxID=103762 RepID=A0A8J5SHP9_ZIZPA|nr:hypothetical protein GUJ93_ZPchr0005g15317 [Zizania palustris]